MTPELTAKIAKSDVTLARARRKLKLFVLRLAATFRNFVGFVVKVGGPGAQRSAAGATPAFGARLFAGRVFVSRSLLGGICLSAQTPARFEVTSVKPSGPASAAGFLGGGFGGALPNGDVRFCRQELVYVISYAYEIEPSYAFDKVLGPTEVFSVRYDIEGKGGTGTAREKVKTLLAERFGLRTHTEVRQIPLYALTVKAPGQLGRWLKPSPHNCLELVAQGLRDLELPEPCRWTVNQPRRFGATVQRFSGSINDLIVRVTRSSFREPVIDRTGLTGNFEWEVAFDLSGKPDTPNIFSAFEDQLGLKLVKTTGPYEVRVIDEVRAPTPN